MKTTTMPNQTAAELLFFLADQEHFNVVREQLGRSVTVVQTRALLRELGRAVAADADETEGMHDELSSKAREVLAALSTNEGRDLLGAFGLSETAQDD